MEGLSKIKERIRLLLNFKVPPYLMDHQFQGRAVLPAVEAMEVLAASTQAHLPETPVNAMGNARFDKFLPIENGVNEIRAFNDLEIQDDGRVVSKLLTKTQSKKAKITRTKEHAVLCFGDGLGKPSPRRFHMPKTTGYHVPSETVYERLVPFGPAYHNLREGVTLWEEMVTATVYAPENGGTDGILGSPFPLDAAFHAACVWGQRYAGVVGFPVGFGIRKVFSVTKAKNTYQAVLLPKKLVLNGFLLDVWITGRGGTAKEVVLGLVMKDVSGGRKKPPPWILNQTI
ncbi:conserved hypothetical protein [delta proteobacterium NaphS2]|nr:conserved hypothetical protein [delta proteobacterium NaphS2]